MTNGQVITSVAFTAAGAAAGVYGVSLVSQAAAWMVLGVLCAAVGLRPLLRRR
jgi:uncharacterized membrane protein YdfJ with MMPL/SSD domain